MHIGRILRVVSAFCILHSAFAGVASAQRPNFFTGFAEEGGKPSSLKPEQLKEVSFKQRLNQSLPLDATFKDEYSRDVTLGKYFNQERPVIVAFVYYQCPMLCTQVMNGISSSLRALTFTPGREFDVVLISFDPRDKFETANAKKQAHLQHWSVMDQAAGWHFLTGEPDTIRQVTKAAGFNYT